MYEEYTIYIPIWLDLLYFNSLITTITSADLHSNMVRFIISCLSSESSHAAYIYIPIWLDLLSALGEMGGHGLAVFTFQYG